MIRNNMLAALLCSLAVFASNAHAALIETLGGLAYYDESSDLTWLADAGASGSLANWQAAMDWTAGLNIDGITGWRLPTADTACANGDPCPGSEMGQLFGMGVAYFSPNPFTGVQLTSYWTSTLVQGADTAYQFSFLNGLQTNDKNIGTSGYYAWAVFDGDAGAPVVPVPPAVWLFASGLIGLIGIARR